MVAQRHTGQLDTMVRLVVVVLLLVEVVGRRVLVDALALCLLPALVLAYAGNRSRRRNTKQ